MYLPNVVEGQYSSMQMSLLGNRDTLEDLEKQGLELPRRLRLHQLNLAAQSGLALHLLFKIRNVRVYFDHSTMFTTNLPITFT